MAVLKKIGLMGILLLAVCALAGCGKQEEQDNTEKAEYRMYYLSPTEEALVEDDYVRRTGNCQYGKRDGKKTDRACGQ